MRSNVFINSGHGSHSKGKFSIPAETNNASYEYLLIMNELNDACKSDLDRHSIRSPITEKIVEMITDQIHQQLVTLNLNERFLGIDYARDGGFDLPVEYPAEYITINGTLHL